MHRRAFFAAACGLSAIAVIPKVAARPLRFTLVELGCRYPTHAPFLCNQPIVAHGDEAFIPICKRHEREISNALRKFFNG